MSGASNARAPWFERVLGELSARFRAEPTRALTLDEIGDAIGLELASPDQVGLLFDELEAQGARIESPTGTELGPRLGEVLRAARALKARGEVPTVSRLADEVGLSPRAVRVALLYGEVLGR